MKKFIWKSEYNLKNNDINSEHQYLLELVNVIIENRELLSKSEVIEIFQQLVNYSHFHFKNEEELMKKINYPEIEEHKRQHQEFIQDLNRIHKEILDNNNNVTDDIISFLAEWLIDHMMITDKQIDSYV